MWSDSNLLVTCIFLILCLNIKAHNQNIVTDIFQLQLHLICTDFTHIIKQVGTECGDN